MSALREAAQQALEALESSRVFVTSREKIKHPEGTEWYDERIAALRAALAQQADPTDPGNDVDVLREHVRHLERRVRQLHAQQAEPVQEPVYKVKVTSRWHDTEPLAPAFSLPDGEHLLYTAPPQRRPLPKHDQHCVDVPGYGLMAVRLVRAVERAHGIKEN